MMDETGSRILQRVDKGAREIVERLQLLQDIGTALSSEKNLDTLLARILEESRRLLCADSGSIFVRQDEVRPVPGATAADEIYHVTPWLCLKVAQNDSVQFPFKEMRLAFNEQTIAGYVATAGEIVNLKDAYQLPEGVPYSYSTAFDEGSGYRCKSMLVVPMKNRDGEIIGVIQVINKKSDGQSVLDHKDKVDASVVSFDEVDEDLFISLASQAGVSIEKAKLYDNIERLFEGLVTSFTVSLEKRNKTTYGHCMRVARYAVALAEAINRNPEPFGGATFDQDQLRELRFAGLLHDIGKIAVPEAVLDKENKLSYAQMDAIAYRLHFWKATQGGVAAANVEEWIQRLRTINVPRGMSDEDVAFLDELRAISFSDMDGKTRPLLRDREHENLMVRRGNLTASERQQIERHIVDTWEILKRIPWPKELGHVPHIAACHHEKLNGSGYPWGFQADKIPLGGKILALVDIYEALTAKDRPYKPAIPIEKALAILEDEVRRGNLDEQLLRLFVDQKIYEVFKGDTGYVQRPADPVFPAG